MKVSVEGNIGGQLDSAVFLHEQLLERILHSTPFVTPHAVQKPKNCLCLLTGRPRRLLYVFLGGHEDQVLPAAIPGRLIHGYRIKGER